jgi:hypothetical protein
MGYEEEPPIAIPLTADDESNRFCIQLHHRIATHVDLGGKDVFAGAEVRAGGCGESAVPDESFDAVLSVGVELLRAAAVLQ